MEMLLKLYFVISCLTITSSFSVLVETRFGKLNGFPAVSRGAREYFVFRGIPFAKKPERFELAQPSVPWQGVKNATQFGNACPQFDVITKKFIGEEDCLYLNVYTPTIKNTPNPNEGFPVMVFIHPGGFSTGKSDDFDAKFLMDEDVVLVTINWRLGVLGFLDTEDDAAVANLGLKDQILALQWIKKTISSFNGDASRVTIFGCSAGGAAVGFHMLSEMSKGLFRNGISSSGSVFSPFALQRDPKGIAKTYAESLKCPIEPSNKLVECLKSKTAQELIQAQLAMTKWFILPFSVFLPTIEREDRKSARFLEDSPITLLSTGKFNKLPYINGFIEDDGAIISVPIIMDEKLTTELNEDWKRVTPILLDYVFITDKEKCDNVSTKILKQYFDNEDITEENWASFTNLITDRYFAYPSEKALNLHAKFAPAYAFEFTFPGQEDSPILKNMFGISGDYGVVHSDELQYLFNGAYGGIDHSDPMKHETYDFSENFVKLWVSFATNNKPTATWKDELNWKPIQIGKTIKYYELASRTKLTDGGNLKKRMAFWDKLDIDNLQSLKQTNKKDEL